MCMRLWCKQYSMVSTARYIKHNNKNSRVHLVEATHSNNRQKYCSAFLFMLLSRPNMQSSLSVKRELDINIG